MQRKDKLLVVDGESMNLRLMDAVLREDFEVVCAGSGADALKRLESETFDLILLDVMMPLVNGFDVCREIKRRPGCGHVPVIFVTAMGDTQSELQGLDAGAADFVEKPVNFPVLTARVRAQIELARGRHRLESLLDERTRELKIAKRQVEQASQVKTEFIKSMHHELKTPLTAVLGFADLLDLEEPTPGQAAYLAEIRRAGLKMHTLIQQMLEFSVIDHSLAATTLGPYTLQTLIDEAIELVAHRGDARSVAVRRVIPDTPEIRFTTDGDRFRQVLVHLLSNAVKFNRPGGEVIISLETRQGRDAVCVRDTGVGIAPEFFSRVFTPFDRLGREGGSIEGIGLGLAIARRISESLGCTLAFESTPGVGSCFWIGFAPAG